MEQDIQTDKVIRHIYIHIPFCLNKCDYCSFYSIPFDQFLLDEYSGNLLRELEYFNSEYTVIPETIYFGGGTPSLLQPKLIQMMIDVFQKSTHQEITLEVNPSSLTDSYLRKLQTTDVNRISMGAQSFDDEMLLLLGRNHTSKEIEKCFSMLRQHGFDNISLDLIYGTPGQTIEDVTKDLEKLVEISPEHISTYCLSLGEDVPLATRKEEVAHDKVINQMYYQISRYLRKHGYRHYEISNFSKSNKESKHNLAYWQLKDYIGAGASACGLIRNIHYCNPANMQEYYRNVVREKKFPNREIMDSTLLQSEYIIMNLRTAKGFKISDFASRFGHDFELHYKDQLLKIGKYLSIKKGRVNLKRSYWFVSNSILEEFVEVE